MKKQEDNEWSGFSRKNLAERCTDAALWAALNILPKSAELGKFEDGMIYFSVAVDNLEAIVFARGLIPDEKGFEQAVLDFRQNQDCEEKFRNVRAANFKLKLLLAVVFKSEPKGCDFSDLIEKAEAKTK